GWSPTGREVWWTESEGGVTNFEAIGLDGKRRRLASLPGIYFIQDISPEGALLLERESTECVMMGQLPGVEGERDISWLDFSIPVDISADGRLVLFTEIGAGGSRRGSVYVWRASDAQAVRLGDGKALALSPDGKWALVAPGEVAATKLLLLPTGAGEQRVLQLGSVHFGAGRQVFAGGGTFLPDGRRILFSGSEER